MNFVLDVFFGNNYGKEMLKLKSCLSLFSIFRILSHSLPMVRTYTWNPSTQSSLKIIGNFNNEDEKSNLLPTIPTNSFSTQCFPNSPIYEPNYENGQTTNKSTTVPKDNTQNDTIGSSSKVLSIDNTHMQCPMLMLHSQTASSWQPYHQSFPVYYPISLGFPANSYHGRSHLFPSQITTPVMLEQTTKLRPVDLWHLRPIQIGSKVYYEPVSSSSTLYSNPALYVPYTVTSASLVSVSNNARFQNVSPFHCCKNTVLSNLVITSVFVIKIKRRKRTYSQFYCDFQFSATESKRKHLPMF